MRYVFLLLILCLTFFGLNYVSQYRTPFSFLSGSQKASASRNGAPHFQWTTAAMMPQKGGPSSGTGLHGSLVASPASESAASTSAGEQAAALAAVGTAEVADAEPFAHRASSFVAHVGTVAPADAVSAIDAPAGDQVASSDVQIMDLSSEDAQTSDYIDFSAVPDASEVGPAAEPFALSAEANAFALHIADSIRNSLMDPHGIQFGGIAGLNWSGASANTTTNGKVSGSPLTGFNLGFFADIPLQKSLSFRPALIYSYEGYQPNVNGDKINIHAAFLTAPLDLVYHTNFLSRRLYIGAGPYAAYAMNGTYTLKGINTDMQFGNNYAAGDNLRRMDFGANFMAGILMDRNFILGASFNLGLNNMAPSGSAASVHTRSFGLSIGYVFRNRRNMPLSTSAY
ncbi:porin family protein [Dinghuibacter silviterrae]|uniref:Outer membrane protein with beta-barrel domain n=1 Tax=Dinghuibacter silviterrae TaxID=1539049 RepID=A0A4R8DIJ5_9BACT|nr:porin family protein [Dinghuibacter silviterrae]TDW97563.1 outer membrane protein with beta-barrel domain [Dinghuibacter silviterrae]